MSKIEGHLDDFDNKLKAEWEKDGKNRKLKQFNRKKLRKIFNNSAGGEDAQEKLVRNEKTGTWILKDKSGAEQEKIKLDRKKFLKIKDHSNDQFLKIDLRTEEIIKSRGEWLKPVEKEELPVELVVEKVKLPKIDSSEVVNIITVIPDKHVNPREKFDPLYLVASNTVTGIGSAKVGVGSNGKSEYNLDTIEAKINEAQGFLDAVKTEAGTNEEMLKKVAILQDKYYNNSPRSTSTKPSNFPNGWCYDKFFIE